MVGERKFEFPNPGANQIPIFIGFWWNLRSWAPFPHDPHRSVSLLEQDDTVAPVGVNGVFEKELCKIRSRVVPVSSLFKSLTCLRSSRIGDVAVESAPCTPASRCRVAPALDRQPTIRFRRTAFNCPLEPYPVNGAMLVLGSTAQHSLKNCSSERRPHPIVARLP